MAFDYSKTAARALSMLQRYGQSTYVRRFLPAGFDPITGINSPLEYDRTAAVAVAFPSSEGLVKFDEKFQASLAAGKSNVFLIAASGLTFAPRSGDCVEWNGSLWEIGSGGGKGGLMELKPTTTEILYIAGCFESSRVFDDGVLSGG